MREAPQIAAGAWWRFSRYELKDGHLWPLRDAKLEAYDPWAEYWRSREKRLDPPYQSLLDLLRTIKWTGAGDADSRLGGPAAPELIAPESVTGLLTWCASHGLLGVLPQRALLVTLAPRFRPLAKRKPDNSIQLVQQEFVRGSAEWMVNERKHIAVSMKSRRDWAAIKNRSVPPDFDPSWKQPRVILQELWESRLTEEPLGKTWARFFPAVSTVADEYPWPVPLSPAFWRLYAEPFEDFLWAMINFRTMLHDLTGRTDKLAGRMEGREEMHALLAAVSPILDRGKQDQWRQRWRSMSLLGSFAMMALLDLTEGRRIHECPVDKRMFVADAWQVRYCSSRCRHTAQKRAYRLKKRRLLRRARASSH